VTPRHFQNARPLPVRVKDPFQVRSGKIGGQLVLTIEDAKCDGVRVSERADGAQRAGSIQRALAGQHLEFTIAKKPMHKSRQIPLWYELLLNSRLSVEARYATLVHELAHLYCGHLGTPNGRWWPDRQNLLHAVREFEAESGSYLVCARLGIDTASEEYLAGYVRKFPVTPPISLDRVMKSVWLVEQMGRAPLPSEFGASRRNQGLDIKPSSMLAAIDIIETCVVPNGTRLKPLAVTGLGTTLPWADNFQLERARAACKPSEAGSVRRSRLSIQRSFVGIHRPLA
jgi:hypothetical protein